MSTTASAPRTPRVTTTAAGARVRFRTTPVPGFVDGGWWPRSLDLAAELPGLVRAARASGRPVFRVMYSLSAWQRPPRTITVDHQGLYTLADLPSVQSRRLELRLDAGVRAYAFTFG